MTSIFVAFITFIIIGLIGLLIAYNTNCSTVGDCNIWSWIQIIFHILILIIIGRGIYQMQGIGPVTA
jgi:hypothetical protein